MQGWENVGAIVGHSYGVIEECYSSSADSGGDIYGWRNVGGIAGCLEYVPSGFGDKGVQIIVTLLAISMDGQK